LVIDAGWYRPQVRASWDNTHGDWVANPELFPNGLGATADAIRACGLIPGLWFELETCGERSGIFGESAMMLHRDGVPVTVRGRRFLNMNEAGVVEYLAEKVLGTLKRCGFGYLKLDYNETLGIGCEEGGNGSLGEGLRRQVEGIYRFMDMLRKEMPELVIENCSSGGHRHEPSMLGRTAMSSFSDAHELREIPIIAANLQRLVLPRQCQVWAILRAGDTPERMAYSLASTFLGRMCLSGEIEELRDWQREMMLKAIDLYRRVGGIIKQGTSRRQGVMGESWRHPTGWQSVVRVSNDGNEALAVTHQFAGEGRAEVKLPELAPPYRWKRVDGIGAVGAAFTGEVVLWERVKGD
jgi:alpha-galactosidase